MSKFKNGDRVVMRKSEVGFTVKNGDVCEVLDHGPDGTLFVRRLDDGFEMPYLVHRFERYVEPGPVEQVQANTGHMPDGSSIQKHSAGGLYPCVLVWRDSKDPSRKYDTGLLLPGAAEPIWFKTQDLAIQAGELWLQGRA